MQQVSNKNETLQHYKFLICFENADNVEDYVSEKIFDALTAGCIPVYLGAPNIAQLIPKECFIDFRDYETFDALYLHISTLTEQDHQRYQQNIQNFLSSHSAKPFSNQFVAETIAKVINEKVT